MYSNRYFPSVAHYLNSKKLFHYLKQLQKELNINTPIDKMRKLHCLEPFLFQELKNRLGFLHH